MLTFTALDTQETFMVAYNTPLVAASLFVVAFVLIQSKSIRIIRSFVEEYHSCLQ